MVQAKLYTLSRKGGNMLEFRRRFALGSLGPSSMKPSSASSTKASSRPRLRKAFLAAAGKQWSGKPASAAD